jgi:hypothetical protein
MGIGFIFNTHAMEKLYHLFILICLLPFALFFCVVLLKGFRLSKKNNRPGVPKMRNPPSPPIRKGVGMPLYPNPPIIPNKKSL